MRWALGARLSRTVHADMRCAAAPEPDPPQAKFNNLLGNELPFDRHDWIVHRGEVRPVSAIFSLFWLDVREWAYVGAGGLPSPVRSKLADVVLIWRFYGHFLPQGRGRHPLRHRLLQRKGRRRRRRHRHPRRRACRHFPSLPGTIATPSRRPVHRVPVPRPRSIALARLQPNGPKIRFPGCCDSWSRRIPSPGWSVVKCRPRWA